jgi:hypothetical protein
MNKKVLQIMVVVLFVFFALGTLAVKAEESVDPTGVLRQYLEMERDHYNAVKSFFEGVNYDQHPAYGCVAKDAMPVHTDGWKEEYLPELFPNQNVLSYELSDTELSGSALVAHKDDAGNTFYVWHRLDNVAAVLVKAMVEGIEDPQVAMAAYSCGNTILILSGDWTFYVDGFEVPWYVAKWYLRMAGYNVWYIPPCC